MTTTYADVKDADCIPKRRNTRKPHQDTIKLLRKTTDAQTRQRHYKRKSWTKQLINKNTKICEKITVNQIQ